MPTHDFVDIGDVLKYEFVEGEIITVFPDDDTCTVNIAGTVYSALLFWHGAPTSVLRSNGAIQGAAESFASGDSVIVMKKINASMTSDCKVIYGGAKGKILLQKLVVYQDGHIARADNFPNDYLLYDNIFFDSENCDISWSYRQQKYVVVCSSWAKLVNKDGSVFKTYNLPGTEGYIVNYAWEWNKELWSIRINPTTFINLDHNLDFVNSGTWNFIEGPTGIGWFADQPSGGGLPCPGFGIGDQPSGEFCPMYLYEHRCDISRTHRLVMAHTANWEDICIDQISGRWGKLVNGEWTFDDGSWPKDDEGNLISELPWPEQEYYWRWDHKHDPYTGAQLRLYDCFTSEYVTLVRILYDFPVVDYNFVNDIPFDTCMGVDYPGGGFLSPIQY